MKKNVIISREQKNGGAPAAEFLTRRAGGFEWISDRRAAFVVVPGSVTAETVADWLFWDYDTDYNYNTIETRRRAS